MQTAQNISAVTAFFSAEKMAEETIAAVYLFGSYASETNREDSDIDIAVLYESVPPSTLQGSGQVLASEVEDLLGVEVDLIVLNKADCELVHEVLLGGVLVAERDPLKRVTFEVRARSEYFDMVRHLLRYRNTPYETETGLEAS